MRKRRSRTLAVALESLALAGCFTPVGQAGGRRDAGARDAGLDAGEPGPDAGLTDAGFAQCTNLGCDEKGHCTKSPLPMGTVCRAAAAECDVAESCSGTQLDCPPDLLVPKATCCGNVSWCTGASAECPALGSSEPGSRTPPAP